MIKMTSKVLSHVMLLAGLILLPAQAFSAELSFTPESELKEICSDQGGTFFPSGGGSKVFACLHDNGVLIACGGEGKYSNTCSATTPSRPQIDLQRLSKLRSGAVSSLSSGG